MVAFFAESAVPVLTQFLFFCVAHRHTNHPLSFRMFVRSFYLYNKRKITQSKKVDNSSVGILPSLIKEGLGW